MQKRRAGWTGSTNWTTTGLCTQINNELLAANAGIAAAFFRQWEARRDVGSERPVALAESNGTPTTVTTGASEADVWFTRTRKRVDLAAIDEVPENAKEGGPLSHVPAGRRSYPWDRAQAPEVAPNALGQGRREHAPACRGGRRAPG